MPVDVTAIIGGAVGGALVTSIVGPMVSQTRDRKTARAAVLQCVAEVEALRWAPADREDFRQAIVAARAAGLVASAPPRILMGYLLFAQIAFELSTEDWEEEEDMPDEYRGGIPRDVADMTTLAGKYLVAHLWKPHVLRPFRRFAVHELKSERKIFLEKESSAKYQSLFERIEERSFLI